MRKKRSSGEMGWVFTLLQVLCLTCLDKSGCLEVVVPPEAGVSVTVEVSLTVSSCTVCALQGDTDGDAVCSSSMTLGPGHNVTLQFNCSEPTKVFFVKIRKAVECSVTACATDLEESVTSLFKSFNRTFVWDFTSLPGAVLSLEVGEGGIQEVSSSEACTDGCRYTITDNQAQGNAVPRVYCKKGPISQLDLPNHASIELLLPPEEDLGPAMFSVKIKPLVKRGRMMTFIPEPKTNVYVRRVVPTSNCTVCTRKGSKPGCFPSATFQNVTDISVEFTCPDPQNSFVVEINKDVVCTDVSCQCNTGQSGSPLFPDFSRLFTWDVKHQSSKSFQVDFLESGMRQILSAQSCPDRHTYALIIYQRGGRANIGTFCSGGPVRSVRMLFKGRVSLQLPGKKELRATVFNVTSVPDIKTLAEVYVEFPSGPSNATLFSANYPNFPDDDLMVWSFSVPPRHNYSVRFLNYTEPACVKKDVAVEYDWLTRSFSAGFALSEPQPAQRQGNFRMSLRNCEVDRSGSGLSLAFQVSVIRSSSPVLCSVDLRDVKDFVINIKKKNPGSPCEMTVNSNIQEEIVLDSGVKGDLSFQDCGREELLISVSRSLDMSKCPPQKACPLDGMPASLSSMEACLPAPVRSITWNLQSPEQGMMLLLPPTGGFKQLLPMQECTGSFSLLIAETDGTPVGTFCPNGPLQNVQVCSNISVTITPFGAEDLRQSKVVFLNASFSNEVIESSIFSVVPEPGSPVLLATPGWPSGMRPLGVASWHVSLPPQFQAELQLVNVSWPRCSAGQSRIGVQMAGSQGELFSQSRDGPLVSSEQKLIVPESFNLNISNCVSEEGGFSVMGQLTLQRKSQLVLISVLGAVGALLLMGIAALIVFCVVKRKRKKSTSIDTYHPNGNVFRPGTRFPKTRDGHESHIYESIKHSAAYSSSHPDQVDMYHAFIGPDQAGHDPQPTTHGVSEPEMDTFRPFLDPAQSGTPCRPRTPVIRQDSLAYTDPRMVDNELYTFKNKGDMGPLYTLATEPHVEPQLEDEESDDAAGHMTSLCGHESVRPLN